MKRPDLLVIAGAADQERRAMTSRVAWIAAAAIVVLVLTVQPFSNTDVWWHLALGRLITTSGIPAHEPFSFLPPPMHGLGSSGSTRSRSRGLWARVVRALPPW